MQRKSAICLSTAATTLVLALAGCPAQDARESAPDLDALSPPPATGATDTNPAASAKLTEFDHILIALARGDSLETAITGSSDTPLFISAENVTDRPEILVVDGQLFVNGLWVGNTHTPEDAVDGLSSGEIPEEPLITRTEFPPFDEPASGTLREVSAVSASHGQPITHVTGAMVFAGTTEDGSPVEIGLTREGGMQSPQIPLPGCIADEQFPVSYTDDVGVVQLGSPYEPGADEAYRVRARVRSAEYVEKDIRMLLQLEMTYRWGDCRWSAVGEQRLDVSWGENEMRYRAFTAWIILVEGQLTDIGYLETRNGTLPRRR